MRVYFHSCGYRYSSLLQFKFNSNTLIVNGEVFTWGYGAMGRLGHGNEDLHDEPTRVDVLVGKQVIDLFYYVFLYTSPLGLVKGFASYIMLGSGNFSRWCTLCNYSHSWCMCLPPPLSLSLAYLLQWVPDRESLFCMSCKSVFTAIRRRVCPPPISQFIASNNKFVNFESENPKIQKIRKTDDFVASLPEMWRIVLWSMF